jgi:hypothetical protein
MILIDLFCRDDGCRHVLAFFVGWILWLLWLIGGR